MSAEALFFDRELSWLEFNQRVLNEALDQQIPLLERVKFLAISANNLDEFYRVRVGALHRLIDNGVTSPAPSQLTPVQQLSEVRERIQKMLADQYRCYLEEIVPALVEQGICRLQAHQLNAAQKMMLRQVFEAEIVSVLTPMAVHSGERFPLLANQILNLCVRLAPDPAAEDPTAARFAIIPCGRTLPRFLSIPSEVGFAYLHLEDVVTLFAQKFFVNEQIEECVPFRITRTAEIEVQELTWQGLAGNMADVLKARSVSECIRLEIHSAASEEMTQFLAGQLDVDATQVDRIEGPLALGDLMSLASRSGFEQLRYEAWPPVNSPAVPQDELIFDVLAERDVLLYHPYESFEPVVRFVEEAADDPDVIAIKQTLYRISRRSPIVKALKRAVENGKHVSVLLELKARFDESRNLKQARELEAAGAQVILGVKGLKTHAKICIVVRREPHGVQRYVHFGTGNYNEETARIYSDASLLTSNDDLGADAISFFNAISGYSQPPQNYRKLSSAPLQLRDSLLEMIEAEAERASQGQDALIMGKINALTDPRMIEALYKAAEAGVQIRLNIRGICCLRPGVKGVSENIEVTSIVDRYLEHARIFYFHHGGDEKVFISSADWMTRNLDHRKELLVPIEDYDCQQRLIAILETYFADNVKASVLQPDGQYKRRSGKEAFRAQEQLYLEARETLEHAQQQRRTMFEPHRPE